MNCPTCGLINPIGAVKCDCGFDFVTAEPSETPGWKIDLAWRQMLAAFWAISWPAYVALSGSTLLWAVVAQPGDMKRHATMIGIVGNIVFFLLQAILTPRLVRKRFRSFRVDVIRENGAQDREISTREAMRVWLWILGPQLAVMLVAWVLWYGAQMPADTLGSLGTLFSWIQVLAAGPYGVGLAMRAKYNGFRLQGYGYRY